MPKNPSTRRKLIKILYGFIQDEYDATERYISLATLLKDYGFSNEVAQKVIEIAKQERDHYHILDEILGAIA